MQMKMEKKPVKTNRGAIRNIIAQEDEFISELLTRFELPQNAEDDDMDNYLLNAKKPVTKLPALKPSNGVPKTSVKKESHSADLLEVMQNKMKAKKAKISERTLKKREKKKLMKNKQVKGHIISTTKANKNEAVKAEKFLEDNKDIVKPVKPVFNEEGKIVFSKFNFAAQTSQEKKSKHLKVEKNPKVLLKSIKKKNSEINDLVEKGETDKAEELKQNLAWKAAFQKTEGVKVKDDVKLLSKSIKKKKQLKKKSKQDWKKREEKVKKTIETKQKKRQENIEKKLGDKKKNKLKKKAKQGRIIPGY